MRSGKKKHVGPRVIRLQHIGGQGMPLGGSTDDYHSAKPAFAGDSMLEERVEFATPGAPRGSKLKMSIEKKIENIWLESKELGWSYNDFVSYLLEVLVVLNHRSLLPKVNQDENNLEKAAP